MENDIEKIKEIAFELMEISMRSSIDHNYIESDFECFFQDNDCTKDEQDFYEKHKEQIIAIAINTMVKVLKSLTVEDMKNE